MVDASHAKRVLLKHSKLLKLLLRKLRSQRKQRRLKVISTLKVVLMEITSKSTMVNLSNNAQKYVMT
jgi:hypothetical protein